jgi:hypothetical protein
VVSHGAANISVIYGIIHKFHEIRTLVVARSIACGFPFLMAGSLLPSTCGKPRRAGAIQEQACNMCTSCSFLDTDEQGMDISRMIRHMLGPCALCSGINIESLSTPQGYRHALDFAELVESARSCRLCAIVKKHSWHYYSPVNLKLAPRTEKLKSDLCLIFNYGDQGGILI